MAKLHIDFDRALGRVRPMHGVGQPPLTGIDNRMFHYLKEAGVPYSRPHDAGGDFGGGVSLYCATTSSISTASTMPFCRFMIAYR